MSREIPPDDDGSLVPSADEQEALDAAWKSAFVADTPPSDFADRVLAAHSATRAENPHVDTTAPHVDTTARFHGVRTRSIVLAASSLAAGIMLALLLAELTVPTSGTWPMPGRAHAGLTESLAMGPAVSATVDKDTLVSFDVDVLGRVQIAQSAGQAFYRVAPGTDVTVTTPLGSAIVQGTCFSVVVTDDDTTRTAKALHMLTETKPGLLPFAKGALAGAALASLVVVTVYEGEVVVSSQSGAALVTPGSHASIAPGGAPRITDRDDVLARLTEERDRLRRSVDDLDAQLGTMMKTVAHGGDPFVAENARLKEKLAHVENELRAFEREEIKKAGDAVPWPKDVPEEFREAGVKSAVQDAIRASGLKGEVSSIDCTEFPCAAYGEIVVDGSKEDSARGMESFSKALNGVYPEESVSRHESIWGKSEKGDDGMPRIRNHFAVAVYPDALSDEEQRKAIAQRLRWRSQQYMDAVLSP